MSEPFESRSNMETRRAASFAELLQPQSCVGRFVLQRFLGEGGMGSVWLAEDPTRKDERRDGHVVLKFLKEDVRRCAEAIADFKSAYRKVQVLIHEHICPLLDLGEDDRFGAFQVMPYVKGLTLLEYMKREDPHRNGLAKETVLEILEPVCRALDYAHRQGLIHRDIKPGNIIVTPETGQVTVVDFGLAAEIRTSMSLHSRSILQVSGTEPYMAPEQWLGQAQDGRSDQYSLAVVAWQMLTGALPYQGSGMQLGFAVMNAPIPELPESLRELRPTMERAFAKDRKMRFGSLMEFWSALSGRSSLPAGRTLQETVASVSDEDPPEDLAAMLQKSRESFARLHSQARSLMKDHRYIEAAEILQQIPEHLRDRALFTESNSRKRRILELDQTILKSIREVRTVGLAAYVEELLALQPHRLDMQKLLSELPPIPVSLTAPFSPQEADVSQQKWATYLGYETPEILNGVGMKFRVIPVGTFDMGSPAEVSHGRLMWKTVETNGEVDRKSNEYLHTVHISRPFLMGTTPVTESQWRAVLGSVEAFNSGTSSAQITDLPVVMVSWTDATAFIDVLNEHFPIPGWRYRLPTEAEWEYACRAGTTTPFWFGSELNGKQANCDGRMGYPNTARGGIDLGSRTPVEQYRANAFGLFDTHGNVWEWCLDWFAENYYRNSPRENPMGPSNAEDKVLRGGSWKAYATYCRSAYRFHQHPSVQSDRIGFRVMCEAVDHFR